MQLNSLLQLVDQFGEMLFSIMFHNVHNIFI
jgi:hypothetical protein